MQHFPKTAPLVLIITLSSPGARVGRGNALILILPQSLRGSFEESPVVNPEAR